MWVLQADRKGSMGLGTDPGNRQGSPIQVPGLSMSRKLPSLGGESKEPENLLPQSKKGGPSLHLGAKGFLEPEEIREICRESGFIHGVDPFKGDPRSEKIRYLRLHGITGYRYRFSEVDLRALRGKSRGLTYCMFNNAGVWTDAQAFLGLVRKPQV